MVYLVFTAIPNFAVNVAQQPTSQQIKCRLLYVAALSFCLQIHFKPWRMIAKDLSFEWVKQRRTLWQTYKNKTHGHAYK